jgi:hypothetical protein
VLIFVAGPRRALLAIEAKMYDRPTTTELNDRLAAQATVMGDLAEHLGAEPANVAHMALHPAQLVTEFGALSVATGIWEQLLQTYTDVAPPYFLEVLRVALARHDQLHSPALNLRRERGAQAGRGPDLRMPPQGLAYRPLDGADGRTARCRARAGHCLGGVARPVL